MKKKYKILLILILTLLLMPTTVFASTGEDGVPLSIALWIETFSSIYMSVFVLLPLSRIFSKENSKKIFWILFAIRAGILLLYDFFQTTNIAFIDIYVIFIGAFLVIPIYFVISIIELKCKKCNTVLKKTDKFCPNCGEPFDGNNVVVSENVNVSIKVPPKTAILPSSFDQIYSLPEEKMLEEFISKELTKAGIDKSSKLIPSDILKRKKILNIIFSVLVFIYISLIFFHFPIYTYIIGIIILIIFFKVSRKYDLIKYLKKQIKSRPEEKISNIVMNAKNTFTTDNTKSSFVLCLLLSIILPLFIFSSPRIIYEKVEGGYAVRYYIFGLSNFKTATIPETYKNEKVVSLRENTFSNMLFLETVSLPDSITEIRGQAFKNCLSLKEVNIPKKLEYLGGGAFYNAKSIKRVELPDTLTYLGGEAFYGASSLEYVKLSNNLTEIRGDSFEYCTSLKSIEIPDNITRIGDHAFYRDSSLSEVFISENSKLSEIGSSAFRECLSLRNITIPSGTYVKERAFKESPTTIERYGAEDISKSINIKNTYETTNTRVCDTFRENVVGDATSYKMYKCNKYYFNDEIEVTMDYYGEKNYKYIINYLGKETVFYSNDAVQEILVYDNKAIKIQNSDDRADINFYDNVESNGINIWFWSTIIKFRDVNQVKISFTSVDRVVNGNIYPAERNYCVSKENGYADKYIYNFRIDMNSLISDISIDDLEEHEIYNFLKIKNKYEDTTCPSLQVFIK